MLAHALNTLGHEVHVVSKNVPVFFEDLSLLSEAGNINFIPVTDNQIFFPSGNFDYTFLVPMGANNPFFYETAKGFASARSAKLALINFESGNWFNEENPFKKDISQWSPWRGTAEVGVTILSSASISQDYAKLFYVDYPDKTNFAIWSPAINDLAIPEQSSVTKRPKSIIAMTRVGSPHKGARDLLYLIGPELRGWTFDLIMGSPTEDEAYANELQARCNRFGVGFSLHRAVSDARKYELIAQSTVLVFPSYFEGYGYPPVEAISSGTHCVAYDLPVLREICGNSVTYVDVGDVGALRSEILKLENVEFPQRVTFSGFQERAHELSELLEGEQWPIAQQSYGRSDSHHVDNPVAERIVIDAVSISDTAFTVAVKVSGFENPDCIALSSTASGAKILLPAVRDSSCLDTSRFLISLSKDMLGLNTELLDDLCLTVHCISSLGEVISEKLDFSDAVASKASGSHEMRLSVPVLNEAGLYLKGYGWPNDNTDFAELAIGGALGCEWVSNFNCIRPDLKQKADTTHYNNKDGKIGCELSCRGDFLQGLHGAILDSLCDSVSRGARVRNAALPLGEIQPFGHEDALKSQGIHAIKLAVGKGVHPTFCIQTEYDIRYIILYDGAPIEGVRSQLRAHNRELGYYANNILSSRHPINISDISLVTVAVLDNLSRVVANLVIKDSLILIDMDEAGEQTDEFKPLVPYCSLTKLQKLNSDLHSIECQFTVPERYNEVVFETDIEDISFSQIKLLEDVVETGGSIGDKRTYNVVSCLVRSELGGSDSTNLLNKLSVKILQDGIVLYNFDPNFKDVFKS
jgi:glycosyltransferase involved in cell wall biosynthesis